MRTIMLLLLLSACAQSQIILSEIMFNPQGNERYNEFIELYNCSETESVDLQGWLVSDGTKFNLILPYEESVLPPQRFALILVPNYFENSQTYDAEIPDETLLLTIDRAQLGAYGLKNSEGETVSIFQPDSTLVDAHTYTPDNDDGYSEEKIELVPEQSDTLWGNSVKLNGTPGYQNSLTPEPFDLSLSTIYVEPHFPSTKDSLYFYYVIKNVGKRVVDVFEIQLFDLENGGTLLFKETFDFPITPNDSSYFTIAFPPWPADEYRLLALVRHEHDGKALNDSLVLNFEVQATYPPFSVVINEILYDTNEKDEEWIEIYNASDSTINLDGWSIADKRKTVQLDSVVMLSPGQFCLLANADIPNVPQHVPILVSKLPELNNSGDEIVLRDACFARIDSVAYTASMGGDRLISLERLRFEDDSTEPTNWRICTDSLGCTPGRHNSVSPKVNDAAIEKASLRTIPANPVENDNVRLEIQVKNAGRQNTEKFAVRLSYQHNLSTQWVHLSDVAVQGLTERETCTVQADWPCIPPGVFKIKAEIDWPDDQRSENNVLLDTLVVGYEPQSLVVNEIFYSPTEEFCECIELYNTRDIPVNLHGWVLSDADTSKSTKITDSEILFDAGEFGVIGDDSVLLALEPAHVFVLKSFPSLANDRDHLLLFDGVGHNIESVTYENKWGGSRGRSLERINPFIDAAEPTNWTTCVEPQGHTMGRANSVFFEQLSEKTTLDVSPNPFSPDGDGRDDRAAISYLFPGVTARVNLKIFDIRGRLVRFLLNNEPSSAQRTVFWDGLDDEGIRCRMGIYIVYLEALSNSELCVERSRATVVLAGAL